MSAPRRVGRPTKLDKASVAAGPSQPKINSFFSCNFNSSQIVNVQWQRGTIGYSFAQGGAAPAGTAPAQAAASSAQQRGPDAHDDEDKGSEDVCEPEVSDADTMSDAEEDEDEDEGEDEDEDVSSDDCKDTERDTDSKQDSSGGTAGAAEADVEIELQLKEPRRSYTLKEKRQMIKIWRDRFKQDYTKSIAYFKERKWPVGDTSLRRWVHEDEIGKLGALRRGRPRLAVTPAVLLCSQQLAAQGRK